MLLEQKLHEMLQTTEKKRGIMVQQTVSEENKRYIEKCECGQVCCLTPVIPALRKQRCLGFRVKPVEKKKERKLKKNSIKCVNYCKKIQISISIQENVKLFKMFELEMGHDHNNGPVYCACLYSRDKQTGTQSLPVCLLLWIINSRSLSQNEQCSLKQKLSTDFVHLLDHQYCLIFNPF